MNGEELVAEVLDTVTDLSVTAADALKLLNRGLVRVAQELLLPGLSDGYGTVQTAPGSWSVDVPTNFMRELYRCYGDSQELTVFSNMNLFLEENGDLSLVSGPLKHVTVQKRKLVYQAVPSVAKTVKLHYYRKPTPLEAAPQSFLDGAEYDTDVSEALEQAVVNFALWKIYHKIEMGEKTKTDTTYHKGLFEEDLVRMESLGVNRQRPRKSPPICEQNW